MPLVTTDEVEGFWRAAARVNPTYELRTWRDPLDPDEFPISSPHWDRCTHGAQMAGLVRLEILHRHAGIYIDSDYECYRSFDPLLELAMFVGWEDAHTIPDAVVGAEPGHPAILACLHEAIRVLDQGPWQSGPGVFTRLLQGREDVTVLPVAHLYPYHYSERHRRNEDHMTANPSAYGAHHWAASWVS